MADDEIAVASVDRRLRKVEESDEGPNSLVTDVAVITRDVGWIKLIGGAMVAALVWLGVQTYGTNAKLDRIDAILNERLPRDG